MKWSTVAGMVGGVGMFFGAGALLNGVLKGDRFEVTGRLDGKTVIVTGASSGIGRCTAAQCAERGARVIMACRNMTQCELARLHIQRSSGNSDVVCRYCDLSSKKSILEFANMINKTETRLDVLVNSAGVRYTSRTLTVDGVELQLFVNHMARQMLTQLLLDKLKSCQPSRVINVVSMTHQDGEINFADLNSATVYRHDRAHQQSQLASMQFTLSLAHQLADTQVTCNAVYPGLCHTNINRHELTSYLPLSLIFTPIFAIFYNSAAVGAKIVVFAAAEPALQSVTGTLISNVRSAHIGANALDAECRERLWKTTELWTSVS